MAKRSSLSLLSSVFVLSCGSLLLGLFYSMNCAATPTIGSVAETLISGTGIVTRILMAVCMVLGVGMLIVSFSTYRVHRSNPKFVPLDRPIMYLILGLVIFIIPFLGDFFAPTGSILDLQKQEIQSVPRDIDAPL